jgi:amidase
MDPQVSSGIERAAGWLVDAGYDVVDAEPPHLAELSEVWLDAMGADFAGVWPHMRELANRHSVRFVQTLMDKGMFKLADQSTQAAAWMARHKLGVAWSLFAERHPIILAPISTQRPFLVGEDVARIEAVAASMAMIFPINALGLPSCSVPVGVEDELPQAVQLIGPRYREDLILDAARAIELRAPVLTPIAPQVRR